MSPKYQDIIPPNNSERRSIRDIPLPERKTSTRPATKRTSKARAATQTEEETISIPVHEVAAEGETHHHAHHRHEHEESVLGVDPSFYNDEESFVPEKEGFNYKKWGIITVVVLVVFFFIGNLFTHATISLVGKAEQVALNSASFALAPSETQPGIMYDIITLSADSSTVANATDPISSTASTGSTATNSPANTGGTKATGKVIVYNNFSKEAQDFSENTRLQTPDGLIYKIVGAIKVPGQTVSGGKIVPGSLTVTVVAENPGEKYNSGPKDFTVFGFKGTPKYTVFYARSAGALAGGSAAAAAAPATVGASTNGSVEDKLREDLKNQLANQITAQLPENFVYLPESIIITYASPIVTPGATGKVSVSQRATATAVIMDKESLIKNILKANAGNAPLPADDNGATYDADLSSLTVALPSGTTGASLKEGSAKILLNGTVIVKPVFNTDKISRAVSTLPKEQAVSAIKGMDNVESVDISLTPFWKNSLPRADKITIK